MLALGHPQYLLRQPGVKLIYGCTRSSRLGGKRIQSFGFKLTNIPHFGLTETAPEVPFPEEIIGEESL